MCIIYNHEGLKNPNLTPADRIRLGQKGAGRWMYCKYCYRNVLPVVDEYEDLIVCSECGYGLAVLSDSVEEGLISEKKYPLKRLKKQLSDRDRDFKKKLER